MLVICSKRAVVTLLVAVCVLGFGAATAAAEGPPAAGALVEFEYRLSGVKPVGGPESPTPVAWSRAVAAPSAFSRVWSQAVSFTNVLTSILGWSLVSVGNSPLTATVDDWRYVNGGTVTGTASFPAGHP